MYRIVVAEDEPAALGHVCMILEKKCPQYQIIGTAGNGLEALCLIRREQPDVLISDVRMPVMDGIRLISKVKEEYPEILSIIVSGYSEFEYAKGALQSGVCDYILKPLAPSDIKELMDRLEPRLDALYYEKRNKLLKVLCSGAESDFQDSLYRYFPKGRYYAAIYRKNGLPKRFSQKTGVEIFSMEEEKVYIYGRDEMESLYFFPENLLFLGDFREMAECIFEKERNTYTYLTAVMCEEPLTLEEFPRVVKRMYRKLDESIVIGENQMQKLSCERMEEGGFSAARSECEAEGNIEEKKKLEHIEYLIRYKENGKFTEEIKKLFNIYCKQKYSQICVESAVKYIFQLIYNTYPSVKNVIDLEFMLDDAFYYAANMQELTESILTIIKQCVPELGKEKIDNKEQFFQSIISYLNGHMEEAITLGSICKRFGISQTSLSRMFRTYEGTSFSNYLTRIRIEKAKQMMQQDPEAYIRDIAERVGYSDQFYFSRIFRSVTGICPKEYMEKAMLQI